VCRLCRPKFEREHPDRYWDKKKKVWPYKDVTNALIKAFNEVSYRKKEEVVEKLCKLL
jgi:hypothetical protein